MAQGARAGGCAAWLAGGWRGECMGWVTHRMLRRGCETSLPYLLALLSRTPLSRSLGCLSHVCVGLAVLWSIMVRGHLPLGLGSFGLPLSAGREVG